MTPILLFDVMDTVVWDPYRLLPGFFGLGWGELAPLLSQDAWVAFERDLIDEDTYLRTFFADGRDYDRRGFVQTIRGGYRWIEGMQELLRELRDVGAAMHALSNYPNWYRHIDDRLGLGELLPWTFVSCRTGHRKPAPAAYLGAAEALGVPPARCLFVDDRRRNCEGARAVGMHALRFTDAATLRRELIESGVLRAGR